MSILQKTRRDALLREFGANPDTTFGQDTAQFARDQAPGIALSALPVIGKFPKLAAMLAGPDRIFHLIRGGQQRLRHVTTWHRGSKELMLCCLAESQTTSAR